MQVNKWIQILLNFALGVVLCMFVGCGDSDMGSVSGTITLGGQPLDGATITFSPEDGQRLSMGETDSNGYYTLEWTASKSGATIGKHSVAISTYADLIMNEETFLLEKGTPERVPMKYNTETTLTVDVTAGRNTHDWDLDSDGKIADYSAMESPEGDMEEGY